MNVVYSDRAKQTEECFKLLRQATGSLKEIIGPLQGSVHALWDQVVDEEGSSLYSLKISDASEEAEATFAPDELQSKTHMRFRLARLWSELLRTRSHKLMEALREPFNMEED